MEACTSGVPPYAATKFSSSGKQVAKGKIAVENEVAAQTVPPYLLELGHANNLFVSDVRLVWTAIEGLPICSWNKDAIAKIVSPWVALSDDDTIKIIVKGKIYWIRIRELEAWSPEFDDKFRDTSSVKESGGEKHGPIQEEDLDHISESNCMKENNEAEFIEKAHTHEVQSEDPFEIYDLLNKKEIKNLHKVMIHHILQVLHLKMMLPKERKKMLVV
ncbi:hypothetical protein Tco_0795445 [Tanacetum coccineum]